MPDTRSKKILTTLSIITAVIMILGAGWTGAASLDKRYMKVADYRENEIRKLEDTVFELQMKQQLGSSTPVDNAMLDRYKLRLEAERNEKE